MRILVIPDIHLKKKIIEEADLLLEKQREKTGCVFLGDLADDWDCQLQFHLYEEIYDAAEAFMEKYPDSLFCLGNHDVAYVWERLQSGYSPWAQPIVRERVCRLQRRFEERVAYAHRIGGVLFSHAGITESFLRRVCPETDDILRILEAVNRAQPEDLWRGDSVIWARPQYGDVRMALPQYMQVVGHTPVTHPLWDEKKRVLTLDTFSTTSTGWVIGDARFVIVDTEELTWRYAGEEEA